METVEKEKSLYFAVAVQNIDASNKYCCYLEMCCKYATNINCKLKLNQNYLFYNLMGHKEMCYWASTRSGTTAPLEFNKQFTFKTTSYKVMLLV